LRSCRSRHLARRAVSEKALHHRRVRARSGQQHISPTRGGVRTFCGKCLCLQGTRRKAVKLLCQLQNRPLMRS
jgi:hypothetical protein